MFVPKKKLSQLLTKTPRFSSAHSAFTIVELLIVIVIIAILAAITIISYNGITNRTKDASLKTNLSQAAKKLETEKIKSGTDTYPSTLSAAGVSQPSNIILTYNGGGLSSYCLQGTYEVYTYYVSSADAAPKQGSCPAYIQTITTATCPTTRTVVADARDNRSYWVQKMSDGKCWMLTNLAYAGGGNNAYGDAKTIVLSTSGESYDSSRYYIPASANPTSSPTPPSVSNDGGGSGAQYGYLYNWCSATGVQTASCVGNTTAISSLYDASISICPANWRLPTAGSSGEFSSLTGSIGATSDATGATNLRNTWLAQYSGGYWSSVGGFINQGTYGYFWSSSYNAGVSSRAYSLDFSNSSVTPSGSNNRSDGRAVRCVAQV